LSAVSEDDDVNALTELSNLLAEHLRLVDNFAQRFPLASGETQRLVRRARDEAEVTADCIRRRLVAALVDAGYGPGGRPLSTATPHRGVDSGAYEGRGFA
jgi:hypothetical protein